MYMYVLYLIVLFNAATVNIPGHGGKTPLHKAVSGVLGQVRRASSYLVKPLNLVLL